MKTFVLQRSILLAVAALGATLPAFGGTILFTCNANIDATVPGTCGTLNTTITGLYASTFTNANASIFIQYGATGLGASNQFQETVSYSAYLAALTAHESGANDVTAVGSLSPGNPTASTGLPSFSTMVGVMEESGVLPGAMAFLSP